eukprot:14136793-Alexandrium_andersonii.AAC.1
MGGPQQRGRDDTECTKSLCGQRHSVLQRRLHVRSHTPSRSPTAAAVRLGNPAPGPRERSEARGPEGSLDR